MKIEIWNEEKESEVQPLRLRLLRRDGEIVLTAVDKHGARLEQGDLLAITSTGCLTRYGCVDDAFGLKLNDEGKLEIL